MKHEQFCKPIIYKYSGKRPCKLHPKNSEAE